MDLQNLTNAKTSEATPSRVPPPKRKWLTRIGLPLLVLLTTLSIIGYAARDAILPVTEVHTTAAVAMNRSMDTSTDAQTPTRAAAAATVVAQAPGWVEPDPYPVYATALADGVVERIHVLEGDTVKQGQRLVDLIDEDAKLALALAQAHLREFDAAVSAAEADYTEPIALQRNEAVAKAQVAAKRAALTRLDAEVAKESARLAELLAAYDRLAELDTQSVSALKVDEAKYRAESQRAVVDATKQQRPELEAQLRSAEADYAAAKRELELKTQLKRVRDEAIARRGEMKTRVAQAELRLSRMTINSPVDGVVMARLVGPGSKVMLDMDSPHSSHVIHLYDPESLQVRVDVPLADAAQIGLGTRAEIVFDVLPDETFRGEVTRLVNMADIAKNTVQFKVAIENPSPLLKPDMLARVKFYEDGDASVQANPAATGETTGSPVAIRQTAVVDADGEAYVWWVSPTTQRLEQRNISLGERRSDGTVVVISGLNPGDLVVDAPDAALENNQRVRAQTHQHPGAK
jgi:RND family efflux transporter MFP subunit